MDFNDTPEEAAFRAEVRAWLEANAPQPRRRRRRRRWTMTPSCAAAKAWQARKAAAGYAVHHLAQGVPAAAAARRSSR
jgi:hypothetical protein